MNKHSMIFSPMDMCDEFHSKVWHLLKTDTSCVKSHNGFADGTLRLFVHQLVNWLRKTLENKKHPF